MNPDEKLETLIWYVTEMRWPIFPCKPREKIPLTKHGHKDASIDPEQILRWHKMYPDANWAVRTGNDSIDVIDIDKKNGGFETLERLESEHGEIPRGPYQITGGDGLHIITAGGSFGNSSIGRIGKGIDVKSNGGYIMIDPSIHPSGKRYDLKDREAEIPHPPQWIVELNSLKPSDTGNLIARPGQKIPTGARHIALVSLCGTLRRRGLTDKVIEACLLSANREMMQEPYTDEAEIHKIIKSSKHWEAEDSIVSVGLDEFIVNPNAQPTKAVLALSKADKDFESVLNGEHPKIDAGEHSLIALGVIGYRNKLSDQEVSDVICFYLGLNEKRVDPSVVHEAMISAKNAPRGDLADSVAKASAKSLERMADGAPPSAVAEIISNKLGISVSRITREGKEDPRFFIYFGNDKVALGKGTTDLLTQPALRMACAGRGHYLGRLTNQEFESILNVIVTNAEYEDRGEAEGPVWFDGLLTRYLDATQISEIDEAPTADQLGPGLPMLRDGVLSISLPEVLVWIKTSGHHTIEIRNAVEYLRVLGWESQPVRAQADSKGNRLQRRRWLKRVNRG